MIDDLKNRVRKLEHTLGDEKCPTCGGSDTAVRLIYRRDFGSKKCELVSGQKPEPCPTCGKTAPVQEIEEIVIHNRQDAVAFNRG
jgi:endogenous inhibitor of DNA gyrase (YacG/DUF329 family)